MEHTAAEPSHGTDRVNAWVLHEGLIGTGRASLFEGYCMQLREADVPLMRAHVAQTAFHPVYGSLSYQWWRDGTVERDQHERAPEMPDQWLRSPFYHMISSGLPEFRARLVGHNQQFDFPVLDDLRSQGATDYFAAAVALEPLPDGAYHDPEGATEGLVMSWTADGPDGFSDRDIALIRDTLPTLSLALKSAANRRMAHDLMHIYLGQDAGQRVLSGEIRRGSLQTVDAVVAYFDLEGFTMLAEQVDGHALIEMLNAYFGLAVGIVENRGGHVLKFMGDGLLAMFDDTPRARAAHQALDAAAALRDAVDVENARRRADGLPSAAFTLALHAGEILYGNIGADTRLDFTVIGPAVNLTARLSGMHAALGQRIIVSAAVHDAAGSGRPDIVSLGRYMVRGVAAPQELFTLHSDAG